MLFCELMEMTLSQLIYKKIHMERRNFCLIYPRRKKFNWFISGERGDYSTKPPYSMTYYWNVSRIYSWTLDNFCGESTSCQDRTWWRSFDSKSSWKSDVTSFISSKHQCLVNMSSESTELINLFLSIPHSGIYRPADLISNFDNTSRITHQPETDVLFIIHSIT